MGVVFYNMREGYLLNSVFGHKTAVACISQNECAKLVSARNCTAHTALLWINYLVAVYNLRHTVALADEHFI